ncbi:hypothetical protein HanXRQr2_Chr09g0389761 [Helianthus annuus]|uniref:Uncharacterized protein n=1 Tax=Helianthus annuus TaxID=4232 RepID=A0A9K3N8E3_HELAN|nr:hypothetical protein HanXRQr2_Chr09g0389761 [Helianthus annuus]KAJ0893256.1 hypothetical protein HanPSC8_Chr09g0375591 [Helianthus annuus]
MNSDSPPPTFSSGNFRGVESELQTDNQPTVEVQAPTMSIMGITNSEPQFSTEGQRLVPDEPYVPPQSLSDIRHLESSFTGGDVDRVQVASAQAPDVDAAGHVHESLIGLNAADSGSEPPPTFTDINQRDQSNPGHVSAASPAYDPQENVSIPGRHFPRGNLTGPYYS